MRRDAASVGSAGIASTGLREGRLLRGAPPRSALTNRRLVLPRPAPRPRARAYLQACAEQPSLDFTPVFAPREQAEGGPWSSYKRRLDLRPFAHSGPDFAQDTRSATGVSAIPLFRQRQRQ